MLRFPVLGVKFFLLKPSRQLRREAGRWTGKEVETDTWEDGSVCWDSGTVHAFSFLFISVFKNFL